ncbi:hypothetical protein [Mesorhizobium loti]|uniref:hypothetical protein n=1 Tax=Rhizobium loti TaxID=381 RepID=UPI00126910DA|nr:hypothetical protein [Mesorhizobium loti]
MKSSSSSASAGPIAAEFLFDDPLLAAHQMLRHNGAANIEGAIFAIKTLLVRFADIAHGDPSLQGPAIAPHLRYRVVKLRVGSQNACLGSAISVLGAQESQILRWFRPGIKALDGEVVDALHIELVEQRDPLESVQRVVQNADFRRLRLQSQGHRRCAVQFIARQPIEVGLDVMGERCRPFEKHLLIGDVGQQSVCFGPESMDQPLDCRAEPGGDDIDDHSKASLLRDPRQSIVLYSPTGRNYVGAAGRFVAN